MSIHDKKSQFTVLILSSTLHSQLYSSSNRQSFTTLVNSAISQAPDDFTPPIADEDTDDWLSIDAENFEGLLQRTPGNDDSSADKKQQSDAMDVDETPAPTQRVVPDQASQLRDLASKVEEFIEGEGDVEGARFAE